MAAKTFLNLLFNNSFGPSPMISAFSPIPSNQQGHHFQPKGQSLSGIGNRNPRYPGIVGPDMKLAHLPGYSHGIHTGCKTGLPDTHSENRKPRSNLPLPFLKKIKISVGLEDILSIRVVNGHLPPFLKMTA
jgi:hypothetical protein